MLDTVALKDFTQQDLAILGVGEIAYVRPVQSQGENTYAVMGANGQRLGVAPDYEAAVTAAYENDLLVVPLH